MYMGNMEYWDEKFADRADTPLSPEKTLVDNIAYLKKGTVLDVACGDGRNTLFLLGQGFRVTGVDFSNKALERLKMFTGRNGYQADTKQIDLSLPDSLKDIGVFDNILVNHYKLNKGQLNDIGRCLTDGGILFISGFGVKAQINPEIKEEDLIHPADFDGIRESFELIRFIENEDSRGFFLTYIFRKAVF